MYRNTTKIPNKVIDKLILLSSERVGISVEDIFILFIDWEDQEYQGIYSPEIHNKKKFPPVHPSMNVLIEAWNITQNHFIIINSDSSNYIMAYIALLHEFRHYLQFLKSQIPFDYDSSYEEQWQEKDANKFVDKVMKNLTLEEYVVLNKVCC
jgi:hypothetical protein